MICVPFLFEVYSLAYWLPFLVSYAMYIFFVFVVRICVILTMVGYLLFLLCGNGCFMVYF